MKDPPPNVEPMENWLNDIAKVVLKPVCQDCQRRLNVQFEDPAADLLKAMLSDSVLVLSPAQQVLLAGWFVKTALVLALARAAQNPGPTLPHETTLQEQMRAAVHKMLKTGVPPKHTTLRVAYATPLKPPPPDSRGFLPRWFLDYKPALYSCHIGLFVMYLAWETLFGMSQATLVALTNATQDDDRFVTLWPPNGTDITWPPNSPISYLEVETFLTDLGGGSSEGGFPIEVRLPAPPNRTG